MKLLRTLFISASVGSAVFAEEAQKIEKPNTDVEPENQRNQDEKNPQNPIKQLVKGGSNDSNIIVTTNSTLGTSTNSTEVFNTKIVNYAKNNDQKENGLKMPVENGLNSAHSDFYSVKKVVAQEDAWTKKQNGKNAEILREFNEDGEDFPFHMTDEEVEHAGSEEHDAFKALHKKEFGENGFEGAWFDDGLTDEAHMMQAKKLKEMNETFSAKPMDIYDFTMWNKMRTDKITDSLPHWCFRIPPWRDDNEAQVILLDKAGHLPSWKCHCFQNSQEENWSYFAEKVGVINYFIFYAGVISVAAVFFLLGIFNLLEKCCRSARPGGETPRGPRINNRPNSRDMPTEEILYIP